MKYKVGDKVEYVPHMCHAFNCNQNNEYPWVIGMKVNPQYKDNPHTGEKELVEDVVELDEGRLHRTVLPGIFVEPESGLTRKKLVPLRPVKPWLAIVRGLHGDALDLDIDSNVGSGMITLHYDRVPVDESGLAPHSCRRVEKEEDDAGNN